MSVQEQKIQCRVGSSQAPDEASWREAWRLSLDQRCWPSPVHLPCSGSLAVLGTSPLVLPSWASAGDSA